MASPVSLLRFYQLARWLPFVGFVSAFVVGRFFGVGIGLLVAAASALSGCIWIFWSSLQNLSAEAPLTLDEALSLGAPSAEEEQKRAILRALKDLEYERAVGKISEADYSVLSERYRQEAKRLLRAVERDLTPERERAEQLLEERLAQLKNSSEPAPKGKARGTDAEGTDAEHATAAEAAPKDNVPSDVESEPEHEIATHERPKAPKGAASSVEDHE